MINKSWFKIVKIAACIINANNPATTSSAKIPIPPGKDSSFLIGPSLVMSKNLNSMKDSVNDIKIYILSFASLCFH